MIERGDDGFYGHLRETIRVHHEVVWGCFDSGPGLTRWMCLAAEMEPRAGGLISFGWDERMTRRTTIAILEHDPGGRVRWDWQAGTEDVHAPIEWTVEPDTTPGAEGTVVRFRQGPFEPSLDGLTLLGEELAGWCWRLCNLRSVLEAKHDMRTHRPI